MRKSSRWLKEKKKKLGNQIFDRFVVLLVVSVLRTSASLAQINTKKLFFVLEE